MNEENVIEWPFTGGGVVESYSERYPQYRMRMGVISMDARMWMRYRNDLSICRIDAHCSSSVCCA